MSREQDLLRDAISREDIFKIPQKVCLSWLREEISFLEERVERDRWGSLGWKEKYLNVGELHFSRDGERTYYNRKSRVGISFACERSLWSYGVTMMSDGWPLGKVRSCIQLNTAEKELPRQLQAFRVALQQAQQDLLAVLF